MNWPEKITEDEYDILSKEWELAGYVLRAEVLSWAPFKTTLLGVYEHDGSRPGHGGDYVYDLVVEYALEWDEDLQRVLVKSDPPQGALVRTAKGLGL